MLKGPYDRAGDMLDGRGMVLRRELLKYAIRRGQWPEHWDTIDYGDPLHRQAWAYTCPGMRFLVVVGGGIVATLN